MIEIIAGTLEEQIIRVLQQFYPVTVDDLAVRLRVPRDRIERVLHKFQVKGVVRLEPLPGKTYVRLLRNDFKFIGGKHHKKPREKEGDSQGEDTGFMYS